MRTDPARALPLAAWPLQRSRNWLEWVNGGLNEEQLDTLRTCVQRERPLGRSSWIRTTAARLGLDLTLRGPGRPRNNPQ